MKYKTEKEMFFAFLARIDYNRELTSVIHDAMIDMGDWCFHSKEYSWEKIQASIKNLWVVLHSNT